MIIFTVRGGGRCPNMNLSRGNVKVIFGGGGTYILVSIMEDLYKFKVYLWARGGTNL